MKIGFISSKKTKMIGSVKLIFKGLQFRNKKLLKGERRMPRLLWAKKDVVSCEKLRGLANMN